MFVAYLSVTITAQTLESQFSSIYVGFDLVDAIKPASKDGCWTVLRDRRANDVKIFQQFKRAALAVQRLLPWEGNG